MAAAPTPGAPGALDGITVVDLSRVLAGPHATMILGDLGADVVKIERPDVGDDTRTWGPPFVGGTSTYFQATNRNKRSITADLTTPEGRAPILAMLDGADVLVENFKPGTMAR
ncbi:MAG TPA: CoA transferase, partial [Acidimicrobiia bacterium]